MFLTRSHGLNAFSVLFLQKLFRVLNLLFSGQNLTKPEGFRRECKIIKYLTIILNDREWKECSKVSLGGHSITTWTRRGSWGSVKSPRGVTWQRVYWNSILLPKLVWPTVRKKKCSSDREKLKNFWYHLFTQTVKGQNNFW